MRQGQIQEYALDWFSTRSMDAAPVRLGGGWDRGFTRRSGRVWEGRGQESQEAQETLQFRIAERRAVACFLYQKSPWLESSELDAVLAEPAGEPMLTGA